MADMNSDADLRTSRRAVVRTAAWSVPVVAVAAAAPAFAASGASSVLTGGAADKWGPGGKTKHVSWDLSLVNGLVAIDKIVIVFSYVPNGGGSFDTFTMAGFFPQDAGWTWVVNTNVSPYTVTATHEADIAAGTTSGIHVDFYGQDASSGAVSASATITYVNGTSVTTPIGPVSWNPGSEHVH